MQYKKDNIKNLLNKLSLVDFFEWFALGIAN